MERGREEGRESREGEEEERGKEKGVHWFTQGKPLTKSPKLLGLYSIFKN